MLRCWVVYIITIHQNKEGLSQALNAYEREMTQYVLDILRKSAAMGKRLSVAPL
jgi:hypothetical protein